MLSAEIEISRSSLGGAMVLAEGEEGVRTCSFSPAGVMVGHITYISFSCTGIIVTSSVCNYDNAHKKKPLQTPRAHYTL